MNLSTKGIDTSTEARKPSKYIAYGIQELKINSIEVRISPKTGSFVTTFNVETPESTDPTFEGHEGAKGKIGKVQFPRTYVKPNDEKQMSALVKDIGIIADKLGVREQVDAIEWTEDMTIEKYFKVIEQLFKDKFAMWKVCGKEEFWKDDSGTQKKSLRLSLAKWGFVQSVESYKVKQEITFDKTSKWDFEEAVEPESDDLPF
tara:strand:- start:28136 stop:28744 length:609 start_codon:yes stop_codon:yes gene_type:complete